MKLFGKRRVELEQLKGRRTPQNIALRAVMRKSPEVAKRFLDALSESQYKKFEKLGTRYVRFLVYKKREIPPEALKNVLYGRELSDEEKERIKKGYEWYLTHFTNKSPEIRKRLVEEAMEHTRYFSAAEPFFFGPHSVPNIRHKKLEIERIKKWGLYPDYGMVRRNMFYQTDVISLHKIPFEAISAHEFYHFRAMGQNLNSEITANAITTFLARRRLFSPSLKTKLIITLNRLKILKNIPYSAHNAFLYLVGQKVGYIAQKFERKKEGRGVAFMRFLDRKMREKFKSEKEITPAIFDSFLKSSLRGFKNTGS